MRVIAGKYGGRRLKAVPGMKTRPTTDKVKESMFNIMGPYFAGGKSLDLFAGSGGLSIEAVSRGIDHATLIDRQYQAVKTIKENIAVTKEEDCFQVFKGDAFKVMERLALAGKSYDLVFLDPPYKKQQILITIEKLVTLNLLNEDAIIVCETDEDAHLPGELTGFECFKQVNYGITYLTYYRYLGGEV